MGRIDRLKIILYTSMCCVADTQLSLFDGYRLVQEIY